MNTLLAVAHILVIISGSPEAPAVDTRLKLPDRPTCEDNAALVIKAGGTNAQGEPRLRAVCLPYATGKG